MLAAPPVTSRPSALEPLTTTPAPTVKVPAVTRMPSLPVFLMVRLETVDVEVEAPGETTMAVPPAWLLPSRTSGAALLPPVIPDALLFSWKRVPAGTGSVTGPPVVVSVVLLGSVIGYVSPDERPVVVPRVPTMMIWVPANGVEGRTLRSFLMVLKAQPGATLPPATSLPVAVLSLPLTGSTYHLLPLTALQAEQVWLTQAVPEEPQSVSVQQLPVVQLPPQQ